MNKQFFLAWIVTFVVWMTGSFVIHGMLLASGYAELPSLYRTAEDSQRMMPWLIGAHVLLAGAFVAIYARGIEAKPWIGQGFRFGFLMALVGAIPWYMIYYSVQPLPGMFVVKQIAFDSVLCLLLGVTASFFYREGAKA